jgi:uncharacterized phage protein gp47/JayE
MQTRAIVTLRLAKNTKVKKDTKIKLENGHVFTTIKGVENSSDETSKVDAEVIALKSGPVIALAESNAEFVNPEAGLEGVVVKEMTALGSNKESDDSLRLRRLKELRASGAATKDSIQKRLEKIDGVRSVYIDEGEHEFEAVVDGGHEKAIVHTLWLTKPLGVRTIGKYPVKIDDKLAPNKEKKREIRYSRPTRVPLKINAKLVVNQELVKKEIESLQQTIADFAAKYFQLGTEVYPSRFYATILAHPKVLDLSELKIRYLKSGESFIKPVSPKEIAVLVAKEVYLEQQVEDAP